MTVITPEILIPASIAVPCILLVWRVARRVGELERTIALHESFVTEVRGLCKNVYSIETAIARIEGRLTPYQLKGS
jgi:hypothetical protein